LRKKDILFGNLETALSDSGAKAEKAVLHYASQQKAQYLKDAQFDVVSVANNHVMDLGVQGLHNTLDVLSRAGIACIGVSTRRYCQGSAIVERNNLAIGFLGYYVDGFTDKQNKITMNRIEGKQIIDDILQMKAWVDCVVVSLHWGIENVLYPSPGQIDLAREMINAGATLILGHHPHVVQGIEEYKGGLIAYSLGNFQFALHSNTVIREMTRRSIILITELGKDGVKSYNVIPIKINDDHIPHLMDQQEKQVTLSLIDTISKAITEGKITNKWWFEEIAGEYLSGNMDAWYDRIKKYGVRHLLQWAKWLVSPFAVNCYLGLLRRSLKKT
jgi:poly-gamma-glutamate synthesis protein (capsule biosynthesis protein)